MCSGMALVFKMEEVFIMIDNSDKVSEYIRNREPIFHNREILNTREDIDNEMHENFWEISASGKLYTRDFVLDYLEQRYKDDDVDVMIKENWQLIDFNVRHITGDVFMASYVLDGQIVDGKNRKTKRTTLWKGNLKDGFKILYHQGTIIL